ncbi:JmjC domain-containing protein 4 [Spathaspora sp. JA1]|nr:JmjC domain-containing protein 4 [Spathaspora sp. JA1]
MPEQPKSKKLKREISSSYTNYSIAKGDEIVTLTKTPNSSEFFKDFIAPRKPVKLSLTETIIPLDKFTIDNLESTLDYHHDLQIEKKYQSGFGSGQKRVKFGLEKLIKEVKSGNDEFYLTTQYDFDDPDAVVVEEDEDEEEEQFQEEADDDDDDEEEEGITQGFSDNFSETSSIDFNNLRDDFEEEEDEEDISDPILDSELNLTKSEALVRLKDLYQSPLTNLIRAPEILPMIPSFFDKLIPQQINLWMGSSNKSSQQFVIDESDKTGLGLGKQLPGKLNGSSSGLHHDHADNLYVVVQGRKRFTLYSPADAFKLYTVGTIYRLFNSGIIDYEIDRQAPHWKHIRDDGAIVEEIIRWKLDKLTDKDSKEKSKLLKQLQWEIKQRNEMKGIKNDLDPPNFSRVPPSMLHLDEIENKEIRSKVEQFANSVFPGVLNLTSFKVWLEPGDMLYLPAGWFHEVSSFGDENNLGHIALNYWFIPPNTDSDNDCYSDSYWREDWEKTRRSLELIQNGKIELD